MAPSLRFSPSGWLGLGLIAVVWVSTAVVQSPAHGRLATGFDPAWHTRLVTTNWVRTVVWLGRGVLVGWWLHQALG